MKKTRVLIADDHLLVREGLKTVLARDKSIEVVTEVGDGQGAINMARKLEMDVILMDVNMPGTDGILATRVITREFPNIRVIALTIYEDEEVIKMIKAGARAYILKDVVGSELLDTISKVMKGEMVIHPRVANKLVTELTGPDKVKRDNELTKREKDVLALLVQGFNNKQMAETIFISEKTVKNHLTSIFKKLGVKDRTQAAVYALKNDLVSGGD